MLEVYLWNILKAPTLNLNTKLEYRYWFWYWTISCTNQNYYPYKCTNKHTWKVKENDEASIKESSIAAEFHFSDHLMKWPLLIFCMVSCRPLLFCDSALAFVTAVFDQNQCSSLYSLAYKLVCLFLGKSERNQTRASLKWFPTWLHVHNIICRSGAKTTAFNYCWMWLNHSLPQLIYSFCVYEKPTSMIY